MRLTCYTGVGLDPELVNLTDSAPRTEWGVLGKRFG
jgi:hypothetical protein